VEFIRRQIAGGNQKVAIKSNIFYVNGYQYDEIITPPGSYLRDNKEKDIPKEQIFLLNDNRSNTSDSRDIGPVRREAITGKVTRCLVNYPFWEVFFYKIIDSNYLLNALFGQKKGF
jgi:signal peptidase I